MYGRRPDVSQSPEKIPTDDAYPGIKIVTGPSKGLFNSLHLDFLTTDLKSTCHSKCLKFKFSSQNQEPCFAYTSHRNKLLSKFHHQTVPISRLAKCHILLKSTRNFQRTISASSTRGLKTLDSTSPEILNHGGFLTHRWENNTNCSYAPFVSWKHACKWNKIP